MQAEALALLVRGNLRRNRSLGTLGLRKSTPLTSASRQAQRGYRAQRLRHSRCRGARNPGWRSAVRHRRRTANGLKAARGPAHEARRPHQLSHRPAVRTQCSILSHVFGALSVMKTPLGVAQQHRPELLDQPRHGCAIAVREAEYGLSNGCSVCLIHRGAEGARAVTVGG